MEQDLPELTTEQAVDIFPIFKLASDENDFLKRMLESRPGDEEETGRRARAFIAHLNQMIYLLSDRRKREHDERVKRECLQQLQQDGVRDDHELSLEDAANMRRDYNWYMSRSDAEPTADELITRLEGYRRQGDAPVDRDRSRRAFELYRADLEKQEIRGAAYTKKLSLVEKELEPIRIQEYSEFCDLIAPWRLTRLKSLGLEKTLPLTWEELVVVADNLGANPDEALPQFTVPGQIHLWIESYDILGYRDDILAVIRSELCDKGTALMCAWRTDSVAEVFPMPEHTPYQSWGIEVVREIHDRWTKGFYKHATICWDPRTDYGGCGSDPSADDFPGMDPTFLGPTPGKRYDWPGLHLD